MRKANKFLRLFLIAATLAIGVFALFACSDATSAENNDRTEYTVTVSVAACTQGDTVTPEVTVKENGNTVTQTVTLVVTDPNGNAVALRGNSFVPVTAGKYTLKATIAHGESAQTEFTCKAAPSVAVDEKVVLGKNRKKQVVYYGKDVTDVLAVVYGNAQVNFAKEGNKAVLATGDLLEGEATVTSLVKTAEGVYNYVQGYETVDYAIGTAEEFGAFGDALAEKSVYGYGCTENPFDGDNVPKVTDAPHSGPVTEAQNMGLCVLTDNIDYKGEDFNNHATKRNFYGTLDGRGYTLYNVTGYRGLFFSVCGIDEEHPSVIKNLAIVNFRTTNESNSSSFLGYCLGFVNVDNCYFSGTIASSSTSSSSIGEFPKSSVAKGSQISNVVTHIEFLKGADRATVSYAPRQNRFENVYAVSTMPPKRCTTKNVNKTEDVVGFAGTGHTNGKYRNIKTYLSYDAFKDDVTAVPDRVTEYANAGSTFNAYWTVSEGVLMFKSTAEIMEAFNAEAFTVSYGSGNNVAYMGFAMELSSAKHNVLWKVDGLTHEEPAEGEDTFVTVTDYTVNTGTGVPTVAYTATVGSTFTVTAYYYDAWGEVHSTQPLTFTVGRSLAAPAPTTDATNGKVIWTAVDGAASYSVTVTYVENGEEKTVESAATECEFDMHAYTVAGSYTVTVTAISSDDGVHASPSASVTYIVAAPEEA